MFNLKELFHRHKEIWNHLGYLSIDSALGTMIEKHYRLLDRVEALEYEVCKLQLEVTAINIAYRDELCGDCCHNNVCSKRANIKYGDECEDRAECIEIEEDIEKKSPQEADI